MRLAALHALTLEGLTPEALRLAVLPVKAVCARMREGTKLVRIRDAAGGGARPDGASRSAMRPAAGQELHPGSHCGT